MQAVLACVNAVISALNLRPHPKCIRIFLNPQLFLSGFKISLSTRNVFKSNSTVITHINSMVSLIHCRETRSIHCAVILVYCSVRDWTRFCYVIGLENIWIRRPHIIGLVANLFFVFFTQESGFNNIRICCRIACVWTEAVSGKKKWRIQKYPDTLWTRP